MSLFRPLYRFLGNILEQECIIISNLRKFITQSTLFSDRYLTLNNE